MGAVLSIVGAVVQVLLVVILILLLLVFFLLICPISYKGKVDYHGALLAEGRVFWLCGLVYLSFSYRDGEAGKCIRLFGIEIQRLLAGFARRKEKKAAEGRSDREDDLRMAQFEEDFPDVEPESWGAEEEGKDISGDGSDEWQESGEDWWQDSPVYRLKQRLSGFIRAVCQFFSSIGSIWRKIRQKCEWAGEARLFWQAENTKKMVCILKDNVLHLWRKLKPRVLRGNVVFGTGDPCTTGQILGAAAILYAYYGKGIQVVPDFEKARLEGTFFVKGRISLFTILLILLRIFLCDEWSQFRREAKQLKEAL